MILKVLGSSSKGNCYLLTNGEETLILEAGISLKKVKIALDFKIDNIVGCLVTHEHGDHSKYAAKFIENSISVYVSEGTSKSFNDESYLPMIIDKNKIFNLGGFQIIAFDVEHDCEEPVGYLIKHDDLGTLLFATDTYYLKNKFPGVNHILIECNYSKEILKENVKNGIIHPVHARRVKKTHFELSNVKKFLKANDLSETYNIVLMHLSSSNSNANQFKKEIYDLTAISTHVANKDLELKLLDEPF